MCNNIDPAARLARAVEYINQHHHDAEAVILAGDLVDRTAPDAYPLFFSLISDLIPRVLVTLGNHDDRGRLSQYLPGPYYHCEIKPQGAVIVLDSSAGSIGCEQIKWLKDQLGLTSGQPLLVVLHHNITPLSQQGKGDSLRDAHALCAVLKTYSAPLHLVTGHAHITASGVFAGVPFITVSGANYSVGVECWRDGPAQLARVEMSNHSIIVEVENFVDSRAVIPTCG